MAVTDQELAKLVVRLEGDNSKYVKMLEDSKAKTAQAAAQVKQSADSIYKLGESVTKPTVAPNLMDQLSLMDTATKSTKKNTASLRENEEARKALNMTGYKLREQITSTAIKATGFTAALAASVMVLKAGIKEALEMANAVQKLESAFQASAFAQGMLTAARDRAVATKEKDAARFSEADQLKENEKLIKQTQQRLKFAQADVKSAQDELDALSAKRANKPRLISLISRTIIGDPIGDEAKQALANAKTEVHAAMTKLDELKDKAKDIARAMVTVTSRQLESGMAKALSTAFTGSLKGTLDAWKEEQKEVKSIIEDSKTPVEKFNDEIERLGYFLAKGAISMEVFEGASAKANKELENSMKKTKETRHEIEKLDSALYDSAAARTSIEQHLSRNELTGERKALSQGVPSTVEKAQELGFLSRIAAGIETLTKKPSIELASSEV